MMKKRVHGALPLPQFPLLLLFLLLPASVLLMACAPPAAGDPTLPYVQAVEDVPPDLNPWLHSQLHLNVSPAVVFQPQDAHIYILATLGDKSRQAGTISLTEEDGGEAGLHLQLVYHYNQDAPAAADTHFIILKASRDILITLDLQDGVTGSSLAALRKD